MYSFIYAKVRPGCPWGALRSGEKDAAAADPPNGSEQERVRYWKEVGVGAQILRDLGVSSIKLLALRHLRYVGLEGFGIELVHTDILNP